MTLRELVVDAKAQVGTAAASHRTFGLIEGKVYEIVGVEPDRGDLFLKMEPVEKYEEVTNACS